MTRTITTVREYDDKGRVTKETRTETTTPDPYTDGRYWQRDSGQWWQNPIVSWSDGQHRPVGVMVNQTSNTANLNDTKRAFVSSIPGI